jgi:CRP/FNR family cyclic AMP-dependent transcriptional regulator
MKRRKKDNDKLDFDLQGFLAENGKGRTLAEHPKDHQIFLQGDPADAVFYIQKGKVKLTVVSKQGKEAVVALLGAGDFFGEGCLAGKPVVGSRAGVSGNHRSAADEKWAGRPIVGSRAGVSGNRRSLADEAWAGQPLRMASASTMSECSILRLEKSAVIRLLHDQPAFSERLLRHLLSRNIRIEEDLVDQLFNSSEKRLARVLLLLANFGKEGKPEPVIPRISQETLAEIVGTTRSRVSFFMNRFRKLGFIQYDGQVTGGLEVHSSLLNVILHD